MLFGEEEEWFRRPISNREMRVQGPLMPPHRFIPDNLSLVFKPTGLPPASCDSQILSSFESFGCFEIVSLECLEISCTN